MTALADIGTRPLAWVLSESETWASVLRSGGEDLGSLRYETESRAVGELDGCIWIFEIEGAMLHPRIVIRTQGSSEPVATFTQNWTGGGIVTFHNGACYCWSPSHIWSTTHCFRRQGQKASVCVAQGPPDRSGSRVTVCPEAAGSAETPVLVLLGGFLDVATLRWISNVTSL